MIKVTKDNMIFTGTMPTAEEAQAGKVFLKAVYKMCGKQAGTFATTKLRIGKKWVEFKIVVGPTINI